MRSWTARCCVAARFCRTRIAVMLEAVGSMREELAAIDLVVPPGRPMRGGLRVIAGGRA
jgi:hypothetical protein